MADSGITFVDGVDRTLVEIVTDPESGFAKFVERRFDGEIVLPSGLEKDPDNSRYGNLVTARDLTAVPLVDQYAIRITFDRQCDRGRFTTIDFGSKFPNEVIALWVSDRYEFGIEQCLESLDASLASKQFRSDGLEIVIDENCDRRSSRRSIRAKLRRGEVSATTSSVAGILEVFVQFFRGIMPLDSALTE